MNNQKLFDYLKDEHGVTLLQQDMQEIINIVNEMQSTVSGAVCQCKVNRMVVRYEDKDWCNSCGELVKAY